MHIPVVLINKLQHERRLIRFLDRQSVGKERSLLQLSLFWLFQGGASAVVPFHLFVLLCSRYNVWNLFKRKG